MAIKPTSGIDHRENRPAPAAQKKALLVINPNSRRGSEANLEAVLELLRDSGYDVTVRESQSAEECAQNLEAMCDDLDLVIVAGGDGTVSSAAASVYQHNKPLAILPLGTANDLARSLSISDDLEAAGRLVTENQLRRIDLGVVNEHYFFNAVNIGLGTKITHHLTKDIKKAWGVFSYLRALWISVAKQNAFKVKVTVDGKVFHERSIHLTIGNGRYYGGGNVVDHDAEIDSGDLCLYSIRPQPNWKLFLLAPLLRLGRQSLAKNTFSKCGKKIEVVTAKPLEVHADGELVTYTPAKLEIIPQALTVYAPPKQGAAMDTIRSGTH
ncbi:lipid kinase [Proteobacteria bacterium 005FR1]|nr:lipid kinase [Proteobacteria bacterium 005FR1]